MIHHTPSVSGFHPAPVSAASSVASATSSIFDFHGNLPRYAALAGGAAALVADAPPASAYPNGATRYPLREGFVYSDLLAAKLKEESLSAISQKDDIASLFDGLPFPCPPVSNTGGKVSNSAILAGIAKGLAVDADSVVKIDTLTFSFDGSSFGGGGLLLARPWLSRISGGVLTFGGDIDKRWNGYAKCFGLTLLSGKESPFLGFLGVSERSDHMRGRWCLHLTGAACAVLSPSVFVALSLDLERLGGKITRIDLAVDDLTGEHSVEKAIEQYAMGYFTIGGRPPKYKHICSSDGDTFYVGRRGSGKYYRCYQKGRQLGDESSLWVRHEVEFHSQNRLLPLDMLLNPLEYFKGAYPDVFGWIAGAATRIDTSRAKHKIIFSAAMLFAKRQVGRIVRYCKDKLGYAEQQIVSELIAEPGCYPLRLFFNLDDLDFEAHGSVDFEPAF